MIMMMKIVCMLHCNSNFENQNQNQNQNSLLVKRQTDNTTPGGGVSVMTGSDRIGPNYQIGPKFMQVMVYFVVYVLFFILEFYSLFGHFEARYFLDRCRNAICTCLTFYSYNMETSPYESYPRFAPYI